jgi:hypothetical protein
MKFFPVMYEEINSIFVSNSLTKTGRNHKETQSGTIYIVTTKFENTFVEKIPDKRTEGI